MKIGLPDRARKMQISALKRGYFAHFASTVRTFTAQNPLNDEHALAFALNSRKQTIISF